MIVVKAGGRALEDNMRKILDSIAKRSKMGIIFVHGGGDVVSRYSEAMGIQPRIVVSPSGIRSRLTYDKEMEVYNMVMSGKIGKEISAYLNHVGARAISLSGVDASIISAQRKKKIIVVDDRNRKRVVDGGYTGSITGVNTEPLIKLLELGHIVILSPVALGSEGELLNVDGDSAASAVAAALKADALVLLTDVEGVLVDGQLVRGISSSEAEAMLERVGPGMNRKLMAAAKAVGSGVGKAVICSGLTEDPLSAIESGEGTVVN